MKPLFCLVVSIFLSMSSGRADEGDDTLKFFLSKSELVVVGTILSSPSGRMHELGVVLHNFDFKVEDVVKGEDTLKGKTVNVTIIRFEYAPKEGDLHPLLKKDARCLLFLKNQPYKNTVQWVSADFWFALQHPFPSMVRSLKRVQNEESKPNKVPEDTARKLADPQH